VARDLKYLAEYTGKLSAKIELEASRAAIEAAVAIVGNLVQVTPVDTSNAISNWQTSISQPINSEIAPYYPGKGGSTQTESAVGALEQAHDALSFKKPGQPVWIANNADYIRDLNDGSSRQAPAGFVEAAVAIGRKNVRAFKVKV
jgi:hypothetical protein